MRLFKTLTVATALLAGAALAGEPVNVNTAGPEQIAKGLDGIGLTKAEAIVAYREANGLFKHPDELVNVKGVGISTVDRNRDNILLGEAAKSAAKPGR